MAERSKILEVKDLRISFNVDSGTVKAVRGISFDLYRGRTLCIVGESGSGKSVTSRAILGILAKNAIVEGGEIVYDGKDLLAINEDRFHKIRGSKISMIFQDPLSALNPIMRVGKQLTEPIFLKAKANKREASKNVSEIDRAIAETAKAHGITVDKALLSRFKTETIERLEIDSAFAKYERDCAQYTRSEEFAEHPALYPSKIVSSAKKYIAKHPEPPEEPTITAEKELGESDVEALRELFCALITAANNDYIESLKAVSVDAKDFAAKIKAEPAPTLDAIRKPAGDLANKTDACKFAFRDDEDDIIGVYGTSLRKYLGILRLALRRKAKEEAVKAKLEAAGKEPKPLTVKQRAKMPEKVLTPEEAMEKIVALNDHLIAHLDHLIAAEFNVNKYVDVFLDHFRKQITLSKKKVSQEEAKEQALEIMRQVGIPQPEIRFRQYPFEFSGGMRQRVVIAIALSSRPEILICDEPTTALDVTIQAQILELINSLKKELNFSIIFITHDLGVVANMADDIAVMYAGKIVEYGTVDDIFYDPRHPYTWALLSSMPDLDTKQKLDAIPGTPPNMVLPPKGDAFAARNKYALAIDFEEEPPLFRISNTHSAATWLLAPNAPKAVPPEIVTARIDRAMAKRKAKKEAK